MVLDGEVFPRFGTTQFNEADGGGGEVALEEIRWGAGAQFDPVVAEAFASIPFDWLGEISRCPDTGLDAPASVAPLPSTAVGV